jgi:hypothetical protein
MIQTTNETVRTFETGATRSAEGDKPDYEGFLSPRVIIRFGEYMHKHRRQADGTLRASDNWQKGMGTKTYIKSLFRHFVTVWGLHRAGQDETDTQEENLCACLFNNQGMLDEILKAREKTAMSPTEHVISAEPPFFKSDMEKYSFRWDFEGLSWRASGPDRAPQIGELFVSARNGQPVRCAVPFPDNYRVTILRPA